MNVYDALEKVLGTKVAEDSTVFNMPRINPALTKGVTIAGAGVAEIIKLNEAAKLGPITSGKLSDMTDNVGISPGIREMQKGPDESSNEKDKSENTSGTSGIIQEVAKKLTEKNFKGNVMDSAVSGEIVLALHNLR